MKNSPIHLVLVGMPISYTESLKSYFDNVESIRVSNVAQNESELIYILKKKKPLPDVILINLNAPEINPKSLLKLIRINYPNIKTVAVTKSLKESLESTVYLFDTDAFLAESDSLQTTVKTIKTAFAQGFYYSEAYLRLIRENCSSYGKVQIKKKLTSELSNREIQILELICQQKTTQEISDEIFLSPRTVEGHRNSMMLKTGSKNVAGLIVYAFKNELIKVK